MTCLSNPIYSAGLLTLFSFVQEYAAYLFDVAILFPSKSVSPDIRQAQQRQIGKNSTTASEMGSAEKRGRSEGESLGSKRRRNTELQDEESDEEEDEEEDEDEPQQSAKPYSKT